MTTTVVIIAGLIIGSRFQPEISIHIKFPKTSAQIDQSHFEALPSWFQEKNLVEQKYYVYSSLTWDKAPEGNRPRV